jgi:hypothetical protein
MHLLETYALSTGSKIKKPFIIKRFFPVPFEKYITIQNSSGMTGKCYDYFQEVINFIYPKLLEAGITIVQIGSKEDSPLEKTVGFHGQTDINQTAYILSNSMLHIGNDSFAIHMASAFGIPLIGLYSVSSPEIAGPFWQNDKQICLTPPNWRPSFNPAENPKKVNEIKIEDIIESVNKLLFKSEDKQITSHFLGSKFLHRIIECYGDQAVPTNFQQGHLLNVRLDYKDIEDVNPLFHNLSTRPCCIVTKKPFNLQLFKQFEKNISMIIYDITDNLEIQFIDYLSHFGAKFACIFRSDKSTQENFNNKKLELIDYPINIEEVNINKSSIDLSNSNLFYRSNKIIMANNKIYASKAALEDDKPINITESTVEQAISEIKNLNLFMEELEYFHIYEKTS